MNNQTYNTVIEGDCLRILPLMPAGSVDFVLTDPPYLARYRARDGCTVPNDDNAAWLRPAFAEIYRVLAPDRFAVLLLRLAARRRFLDAFRAAGFRVVGHLAFPKRYTSATRFTALPARDGVSARQRGARAPA